MMIRGVRGAITVEENTKDDIWSATQELLETMVQRNNINEDDVASILFTTTPELTAAYPARAARIFGWSRTALMGFVEADIKDGLQMCIRVLIHWNTDKSMDEISHVFLRDAVKLRPDLQTDDATKEA